MIVGLLFVAGLLLGTLLNSVIVRLPRDRPMLGWPHCTRTGEPLKLWQLIPVVGWLLQGGRASNGKPLHWLYPLVELITGGTLVLLYLGYGLSVDFFYLTFVCVVLIVVGAIDWLYRWIYTYVVLGAVFIVLLASFATSYINPLNALIGAVASGVLFIVLYVAAIALFPGKSAPFGLGDVYLGIFIGAAVGLTRLGPALFYGILLAGIVAGAIVFAKYALGRKDVPEYISYGTFLCIGVMLHIFWIG